MPSSFTRVLPNAFGCSPGTPVSVCGTGRGIVRTGLFAATDRGTSGPSRRPCGTGATSAPIPVTAASPAFNRTLGCRNIHRLPIDYAVRPRLRSRLTLGGLPFPRNPCAFGGPASHRPYRYSFRHTHSTALHHPLPVWLQCGRRRSPTTGSEDPIRDCGATLESPSFSARDGSTGELLRTFEMVAASKPTSRLSPRSHFLCH